MRARAAVDGVHQDRGTHRSTRRTTRTRLGIVSVLALCAGLLVGVGAAPATAVQATGNDVPAWSTGWSWTYATTFRYLDTEGGTDVTINENVKYEVVGTETFRGHDAYKLDITGTITGGSGVTPVEGFGNVTLNSFSGSVTGTKFVRRSDLALLQETQNQRLKANAAVLFGVAVDANIDLQLTPSPSWHAHDFPLNVGDTWQNNEDIAYTGGFTFTSSVASGGEPFEGSFPFVAPSNVSAATISVPIGTVATDLISAQSADGQTVNNLWWSPTHKNDARELLQLPLDGARLTIDRRLASASTPAPATTVSETITPSLSCAGGPVTVSGRLSSGASGVPVSVRLDQSQINPGQGVSASTTTTTNGSYSATLAAPSQSDLLQKNGSRASWGVLVSAGGATNVATLVVSRTSCSSLAYTGATSAPQGGSATVSAQLSDLTGGDVAGRIVSFALSGGAAVDATTNAAGVATATLPVAGPPRTAAITASYAGTAALAAASTSTPFTVAVVPTSTTVTAAPSPVIVGDPVTFTAVVTPVIVGDPDGSVLFRVDGNAFGAPVPLTAGSATSAPISTLGLGNHAVTADYLGSPDFGGSTSLTTSFLVRNAPLATTTTSAAAPASSVFGQPVVLSALVTAADDGSPVGSVTFTDGGATLGVAPLDSSGQASLELTDLGVGAHSIVATYSGDAVYGPSAASPKNASVGRASVDVTIESSDPTTVSGEGVGLTASVTAIAPGGGIPDGTVQLVVDGAPLGAPVDLVGGTTTFPALTSLLTGSHTLAAVYSGSASHQGGQASITQQVAQADTATAVTATPSPSNEGQNVAITANVAALAPGSGGPTGIVTFTANGDVVGVATLGATSGGSQATINVDDLAPGSYDVVASYVGDLGYGASVSQPFSLTVIAGAAVVATSTTVTSSQNPSTFGELISFRAAVATGDGTVPVGAVQFSVDGTGIGGPVQVGPDGMAESVTLGSPDPGDHTVIAAFVPAPGFSGSGDIITQTVAAAGVDLVVESSTPTSTFGQGVSFTATVGSPAVGTGTPTGFVQFSVDGLPLGDAAALTDGEATSLPVSDLLPGAHEVTVVYSGDAHFVPAVESISQDVARVGTSTTLVASSTSPTFGQAVTLTATVDPALDTLGTPGGTVSFVEGSTTLATVPVGTGAGTDGRAVATVSGLGAGAHPIRAVYSGSPSFAGSASNPVAVNVAKRVTVLQADAAVVRLLPLGLPLGQLRTTLTSGGAPMVGAPVVFKVGGMTVCTSTTNAAGVATCNATSQLVLLILFNGYTASYAGNADHLSSAASGAVLK